MSNLYISLESLESASFDDVNTLLASSVYKGLAGFIKDAVVSASKANDQGAQLNKVRSHNAVSIDGERGTGKTSVLVNLKMYLEKQYPELDRDIYILDPVDPTLLEDCDSLFLHVIVAAVLSDDLVKKAQRDKPKEQQILNNALQQLAHALESIQSQKEERGMDKLRSLFGNKHLADRIQDFFSATLKLLGKKLLVLPIDDVDTSLSRAFENLEIVRRYLTTPYVLPLISGDRKLYHEVTWRDFHGRLLRDSKYRPQEAYSTALDLANEYQRKVLPVPKRLQMPPVKDYLNSQEIFIGVERYISLANFHAWIKILLAGPVNGRENSTLVLAVPSVRALSQLIDKCSRLIPNIPEAVRQAQNELQAMRAWQMPGFPAEVLTGFSSEYKRLGQAKKRDYSGAYVKFADELKEKAINVVAQEQVEFFDKSAWYQALFEYFSYEPKAGEIYLVLKALSDWNESFSKYSDGVVSIFDTPLFQPLEQDTLELQKFDSSADLSEWSIKLKGLLPPSWLTGLPVKVLLPYPVAEVGVNSSKGWEYWREIRKKDIGGLTEAQSIDVKDKAVFIISLLTHFNFYTSAKRSMMLNIGRVFELLIASLVGPVSLESLSSLVRRSPFYATSSLAPTKTLELSENEEDGEEFFSDEVEDVQGDMLLKLHGEIVEWRERHLLGAVSFSPWLIYKVFNKVFSQISCLETSSSGCRDVDAAISVARKVFYATWAAFGSFEKGALFGLPDYVSTVNIGEAKNFEKHDLFRVNILPFFPQMNVSRKTEGKGNESPVLVYGEQVKAATYYLGDHPLRRWIDDVSEQSWVNNNMLANIWLRDYLGYKHSDRVISDSTLRKLVKDYGDDYILELIKELEDLYPDTQTLSKLQRFYEGIMGESL